MNVKPAQLDLYRTAIPMRRFEHAAATRDVAEAVVARVTFSDGQVGWGETLPREYVTGETIDSVITDLSETLWPICREIVMGAEAVDRLGELPAVGPDGRPMGAAVCALETACLWRVLPRGPRQPIAARVSGVLGSSDPARTAKRLRRMRWFGLRDFKLKLGFGAEVDAANLRIVGEQLGVARRRGRCTLRVDVNGGWDVDTTPERVAELRAAGVCVVEQPVFCPPGALAELARRCALPLMADESLVTADDAADLLAAADRVWWNVRISKNGGWLRAKALCELAAERGVPFVVGCMVGESGILSAAQRRLLEIVPAPRFVEGNYGRFLLADDLTRRSPRFGYGGRLRVLRGEGLGVGVDADRVARYGQRVASLGR